MTRQKPDNTTAIGLSRYCILPSQSGVNLLIMLRCFVHSLGGSTDLLICEPTGHSPGGYGS